MFHQRFLVDLEGSVKRTYQRDVLGDRDSSYADCSNHSWLELIIASRDDEHRHHPPSSGASLGSAAGSIRTIDSSFRRFGHWTIAMTEPSAISLSSPLAN